MFVDHALNAGTNELSSTMMFKLAAAPIGSLGAIATIDKEHRRQGWRYAAAAGLGAAAVLAPWSRAEAGLWRGSLRAGLRGFRR